VCYRVHPYSLALHIYIASLLHSYSINSVLHLLSPTIRDTFAPRTGNFYNYTQNGLSYDNYNLHYAGQYGASYPRSYNGIDLTGPPNSLAMTDAYPPAAYQIEPQKHHNPTSFSDHELNDHLMQMSPYSDMTRPSTPHDDPPRYPHELNCGDEAAIDKEQPYAQLIYKALLHANGHTMILRDI
jgi:hypothetical protein